MSAIEVQGLRKRFGAVDAVRDLTFSVEAGRITGFLGANGAGKTTTLRALLGLVRPTAGSATFGGTPYAELASPARTVGAVLEATGFHPGRRARDHLRILATTIGVPVGRVEEALAMVGLDDVGHRRVGGFSLGMRQRLGLAAALLGDPEILVLDEPANGLDPEGIHWLRELLRGAADQGRTVLVSSHLLAEVSQTVDDVVVIRAGELVAHGALADLLTARTQGREIRVRTPHAKTLRAALTTAGASSVDATDGHLVVVGLTLEDVGRIAAQTGAELHELQTVDRTLEDVFRELTKPEGNN